MKLSDEKERILQPVIKGVREGWEEQFMNATIGNSIEKEACLKATNKFDENEWEWE